MSWRIGHRGDGGEFIRDISASQRTEVVMRDSESGDTFALSKIEHKLNEHLVQLVVVSFALAFIFCLFCYEFLLLARAFSTCLYQQVAVVLKGKQIYYFNLNCKNW